MIRFKFGKILIGIVSFTLASFQTKAQCKDKVVAVTVPAGEFSINGAKVQVVGDGDNNSALSNNIPVKICEGEIITLKSTNNITSTTGINYWIMPVASYSALTVPPDNPSTANTSYSSVTGSTTLAMNTTSSWYTGPGIYVLTQGHSSSSATSASNDYYNACQVIEIIKLTTPEVTASVCGGTEIRLSLPQSTNNNYPEYEIKYTDFDGTLLQTSNKRPTSYPYTEIFPLSDNADKTVTVFGQSQTGECPAPPFTKTLTFSSGDINKPVITEIKGTTLEGEFNLTVTAQGGLKRNVFMRESPTNPNYNFTATPFLTYQSDGTLLEESRKFQVPNAQKQYCFIVEAVNEACPVAVGTAMSNEELCTTPAKAVAQDDKNVITWLQASTDTKSGAFVEYKVERLLADDTIDPNFAARTYSTITDLTFTDTDIKCGRDYYYRVSTIYGATSVSGLLKVTAKSNVLPPKIPLVFADVDALNQSITVQGTFERGLEPDISDIKNYNFYKTNASSTAYSLVNAINANAIIDRAVQIDNLSYCYYVTWTNQCNLESLPSEPVCSILLNSNSTDLKWTANLPFSTNIEFYRVNKVNPATGAVISTLVNKLFTTSMKLSDIPESEGQEIYVQIESKPSNTSWGIAPISHSNIYRLFKPALVSIPQVFTPNVDGYNDSFTVYGKFIKKLKMTILDRWGNTIFYDETADFENNPQFGWNGTLRTGLPAQEGTYIYKIEVEDTVGQITNKEGTVFLTH